MTDRSESCTRLSAPIHADPITRLYATAEAMRHVAQTLPETQGGLAHLIDTLGDDVHCCAALLDDAKS